DAHPMGTNGASVDTKKQARMRDPRPGVSPSRHACAARAPGLSSLMCLPWPDATPAGFVGPASAFMGQSRRARGHRAAPAEMFPDSHSGDGAPPALFHTFTPLR